MQTSSKTRTWANDDGMVNPTEEPAPVVNQPTQDTSTTEELPSHTKKARVQEPIVVRTEEEQKPEVVDQSGEIESGDSPMLDDQKEEGEVAPVSDSDWLRSKTSRLLGLLDEDEQAEFNGPKVEEPAKPQSPINDEPESRNEAIENIVPQTAANNDDEDDEEQEDVVHTTAEQNKNIDLIRDSARLFVRNLAYDTKDADLEPLFAEFGKLQEVSRIFSPFHIAPSTSFVPASLSMLWPIARMMSFLIGTSDA